MDKLTLLASTQVLLRLHKIGIDIMKPKKKKKQWFPRAKYYPEIEKVHLNDPVTVVILKTGEKGICKVQKGDKWKPELGFWVAYAKALRKKAYRGKKNNKELITFENVCFDKPGSFKVCLVDSDNELLWER